jgi:hypothetical protein
MDRVTKATITTPHTANRLYLLFYTAMSRSIRMLIWITYNLVVINNLGPDVYIPKYKLQTLFYSMS